MSFAESILTEDLEPLRRRLLFHSPWTGIERGTLPREAYRLDALAVAEMPYLDLQELLLPSSHPRTWATAS